MRHPYSNLFGSCLLAALILPSLQAAADPMQQPATGLRTNWNADSQPPGRSLISVPGAGVQIHGTLASSNAGGMTDGLQDSINVKGINGLCLANQTSLNTSGNPIGVTGCNGSAGQQWSPYTDGTLRVQGGCLDVVSAGTTSGTNVDWYPCNGTAAQNWKLASLVEV